MPQAKRALDVMVITRAKLQDTLDDAVRRGRMTRDDATELLSEIMRRAEDVLSTPADLVRRVTGTTESFPIDDYDDLTAAQVVSKLDALQDSDLRRVREYERRNANRKTVLTALDARLDQ
jgi:polyhydroxyalkanoate synthesis regulator phasin